VSVEALEYKATKLTKILEIVSPVRNSAEVEALTHRKQMVAPEVCNGLVAT
jgi:hypothetical protein